MSNRVLTVCERGNVRAHSCAQILKDYAMRDDVIAIGVNTVTPGTLAFMAAWADTILIMGDVVPVDRVESLLDTGKAIRLDIGRDVWLKAMHPDLVRKIITELDVKTDLLGAERWPRDLYLSLIDQAHVRI